MSNKEKRKQNPRQTDELKELKNRLAEAEAIIAARNAELATKEQRIAALEATAAETESDAAKLKQSAAEANTQAENLRQEQRQAAEAYRNVICQANTGIPEELISGQNIAEIDESLAKARALVGKVRQGLEAEAVSFRVPTGAPTRTPPDFSGLSSREKIKYAIGGK